MLGGARALPPLHHRIQSIWDEQAYRSVYYRTTSQFPISSEEAFVQEVAILEALDSCGRECLSLFIASVLTPTI